MPRDEGLLREELEWDWWPSPGRAIDFPLSRASAASLLVVKE